MTALGETVEVGAAAPSLSLSGPAELDLFGQQLPTKPHFAGPVRPRLVLTQITVNRQVAALLQPSGRHRSVAALGSQLADGWTRYFAWEVGVVAAAAIVLLGAVAGWRRTSWRKTATFVATGLLVAEGVNLGAIMLTAYSAPGILRQVGSLDALVGRSPAVPTPPPAGPTLPGYRAVVLGDSTAAGVGLPPLPHPTALDTACGRSVDAYPMDLAQVNGWNVLNLACSGATVAAGLLGPQTAGSQTAPPQLGVAKQAAGASLIVVSVGADDVHWSNMVALCAVSSTCDNPATTAFFQSDLASFTGGYFQLLRQLTDLKSHPQVLVNQYYDPFGADLKCLERRGLTTAEEHVLQARLHTLNTVLAQGAQASGFLTVQPRFDGHQLCSPEPYVQGLSDPAPFHPTVAGGLAIALADEQALLRHLGHAGKPAEK
ncbi:MAG: SGNH/GDSL hydrolase family protein [Acidimicrobiales bacterium]